MRKVVWYLTAAALVTLLACADDDDKPASDAGKDSGSTSTPIPTDAGTPRKDSGTGKPDSGAPADPVARGKYIVENIAVCGDCHTPRKMDGTFDARKALSGVECFVDADPADDTVGCLSSRNLTSHETGLKNRSDQEIKDMFTKGERPDGKSLHPFMPYWVLGNMSDEDADAIVAYLRTVQGVDQCGCGVVAFGSGTLPGHHNEEDRPGPDRVRTQVQVVERRRRQGALVASTARRADRPPCSSPPANKTSATLTTTSPKSKTASPATTATPAASSASQPFNNRT